MTSPTKSPRRTKAEVEALCDAMFNLIESTAQKTFDTCCSIVPGHEGY